MAKDDVNTIGGSIFWIVMLAVAAFMLVYLLIWSFHNDSIRGAIIAVIFSIMILFGVTFATITKGPTTFYWGDLGSNSLSFIIGFVIWIFVAASDYSILSVDQNALFSSIASELPQFTEFIMNSFLIPIAEELFFMIGLPFLIIALMKLISKAKGFEFFDNTWAQIFTAAFIGGVTFSAFHVGRLELGFLLFSFTFRFITIALVYADVLLDVFPFLRLFASFGLGAHIGNNLGRYGIGQAWDLLAQNFWPIGAIIMIIATALILISLNKLVLLFRFGAAKAGFTD